MKILPPKQPDDYDAGWRPDVRTNRKEVKVFVVKRAVPKSLRQSNKNQPDMAELYVGKCDPNADDFDEQLEALVQRASNRATSLSLTQNTYNEYDKRVLYVSRKSWKWILGVGIVVGMALPDLPFIPII